MAFTPSHIVKQKKYTIDPVIENSGSASNNYSRDRDEYYIFGSQIQLRESRNIEFKAAQGRYIINMLPETLAKYACAFVNGEGGIMYLGICDDGRVQGIPWNREQDLSLHRVVQETLGKFLPEPPSYGVRIIPVYKAHYLPYHHQPVPKDMPYKKVIRIEIHQGDLSKLWSTGMKGNDQVWVKRDGSVEILNPLGIKDLAISRYKQTLNIRGANREKTTACIPAW
ncbi:schlafen-like protein 1 [Amphiura filiformis]|uniref:schlafen-like protein 1 n=1 Tax=Amphiura filiformis TaxID=82378 RepID=UPI003B225E56